MRKLQTFALLFILTASCPTVSQALITNQTADVVTGQPDMLSNAANNGGVGANTLYYPPSVSSDGTRLFVADYINNRVLIYNTIPTTSAASADIVLGQPNMTSKAVNNGGLGANTLSSPQSVSSDGTRLFVADTANNRVLIYNTVPTTTAASADIVIGQPNMTSKAANDGGLGANTLSGPWGIQSDKTRLFVADYANNRVLIYNTIPTTTAASADIVLGQPNMTSNVANNGGVNANTLYSPMGVCSDGIRLFITDYRNNRALVYSSMPTTNYAMANVVLGQPSMLSTTANNGGLSAKTLSNPWGVYSDKTRLFLADYANHRVLIYNTIPTTNTAAADIVLGQPNMTSNTANNGGLSANSFLYPTSIYSDKIRLFLADYGNHRILLYYPNQLASLSPNYAMAGKTVQITVSGDGCNTTISPTMSLARDGYPSVASISVVQNSQFNYTYTLDLTQAVPNCYDVTVTANAFPRSLKQAFTILAPLQTPIEWKINDLGSISAQTTITNFCALDIGDADQDNGQELYVANQDSALYQVKKLTYGWNITPLPSMSGASFNNLLLTDVNGNQGWKIYGASSNDHVYEFKTAAWLTTDFPDSTGTGSLFGLGRLDADHDGIVELYVAKGNGHVLQIKKNSRIVDITTSSFPASQGNALAAGDGNNDNTMKLYSANSDYKLYQYIYNGTWQASALGSANDIMYSVAVGDGDNDGKNEVYGASKDGYIYQSRWSGSAWSMQSIGTHGKGAMCAVAVSDGDDDGSNEVFAACGDGHVYEFKYDQGTWSTLDLGNAGAPLYALAVGDADNDHQFEVYALGQNNHVYQFKANTTLSLTTPTPNPTAISDSEKKLKVFHSQINPNHGEQARIRWYQSDNSAVTLVIYNLLGDKITTLAENRSFAPAQLHEVSWNGKNSDGATAASGIYIVYLQSGNVKVWSKVAIIR